MHMHILTVRSCSQMIFKNQYYFFKYTDIECVTRKLSAFFLVIFRYFRAQTTTHIHGDST